MSYILDALRKSDQQRRLGGVPSLTYANVAAVAPERSTMLSQGLLGVALIIAVGMAIFWLRPSPPEPAMITAIAASPVAVVPRQTVTVPALVAPVIAVSAPEAKALVTTAGRETRKLSPRAIATGPVGAGGMSNQNPVASQDMPLSIRKTLPVMTVAVHAYSSTAQDRLVSINGRMLREGDSLAPDLRLEQITPDGMIFTYRGYRFRRGAQ